MPGIHSVMSKPSIALTPLNTSPKLWFDASDTSTFTTISKNINNTTYPTALNTWTSKGTIPSITLSAGTYSVAQSGETLNGKNILAADDYGYGGFDMYYYDPVSSNNPWDTYYNSNIISLFLVARPTFTQMVGWAFAIGDVSPNEGNSATDAFYISPQGSDVNFTVTQSSQSTVIDTPASWKWTEWHVYCMTFDGTNLKLYQDGVLYKHYIVPDSSCGLTQYSISGGAKIGEIIAYNYTNANLVSNISSYLKTKWGL